LEFEQAKIITWNVQRFIHSWFIKRHSRLFARSIVT